MTDIHTTLATLRRPKILLRTARAGVREYRRKYYLKQIGGISANLYGDALLDFLLTEESQLEIARKAHDIDYRAHRHVAIMTALLAEAGRPLEYKMAA